jgi:hypothetical protein
MATVVLQAAGAAVGTMLGGPVGGLIGRAIGAVAGSFIDQQLFGSSRTVKGPRLTDLRVMSSSEGAPIPRLWGRMRVSGQVIWATDFEERQTTERQGGKGGNRNRGNRIRTYSYFASFAVGLCEGEIDRIGRVWADGKAFDLSAVTARIYKGSEAQEPDSLIVAKLGAGNAPAYRGLAYIVFERLPLAGFGNRLPQLSFEVIRAGGGAETHVRAVSIIPGSTEFGYDTTVVTREVEDGVTEPENAHAANGESDWNVSVGQLTSSCRNLRWASLVTAWFGTDLRCGVCEVKPGVDNRFKVTEPETWRVSGTSRAGAHQVSQSGGGPAYGGTPSDASVIRAIRNLKARGIKVMFHPFVLMDIAAENGKPDPYGGTQQAAYPWRGRITCSVAPGRPGSPDKTDAVAGEVAAFLGTASPSHFPASGLSVSYSGPQGWGYRRMVLHYARLCALAGGVDAFLIGSELRGLTTLRRGGNVFPFVAGLVTLAAEVKAMLPGALVSYGADWTEYSGHRPQDGTNDVFFHLDPLWASPSVGFIGIDNYMPLSDWRDGSQHRDILAGHGSIHDADYLKSNIAGGEGFDWFYRSEADRAAQVRTPITDGAHGKPWVFRVKDLSGFWSNQHFDRPGGVERATPTAFVPRSKPIWFTEAGCAAVDKAANAPNAFVDAKSAENLLPYFSNGGRDDLIQNRYVTVLSEYWCAAGSHNPVSPIYGGPMVDGGRIFFWAWDARPFPQFPARADVWSDAVNYGRGHWLNGRIGALTLGRLIAEICEGYGLEAVDTGRVEGLVSGFQVERVMAAREALEAIMTAYGVDAVESGGRLRFFMRNRAAVTAAAAGELVETGADQPLYALTRAQETDLPASVKLAYLEAALDYRVAAVEARQAGGSSRRDALIELPAAVSQADALKRAEITLQESWAAREAAELALPPSFLALEPGDAIRLELEQGAVTIRIEEIADGAFRKVRGRSFEASVFTPADAPQRGESTAAAVLYGKPSAQIMDLPLASDGAVAHAPWIAATAKPWPGALAVNRRTGSSAFSFNRLIETRATMGVLMAGVAAGPLNRFDRGTTIDVQLTTGDLFSVSEEELLQGGNAAAIGSMETGWEIIQFARAELVAARRYRLSMLLRGRSGSEPEMAALRPQGQRFVLLDEAVVQPQLSLAQGALQQEWRIGPAQYDLARGQAALSHRGRRLGLRPLSPCQLRAARAGGDVTFSWTRRSRFDSDEWEEGDVPLGEESEAYQLEILSGATLKRRVSLNTPRYLYPAAQIAADFGQDPRAFSLRIQQISTSYGPGAAIQRTIHV